LKLKYGELPSKIAFNSNLSLYNMVHDDAIRLERRAKDRYTV